MNELTALSKIFSDLNRVHIFALILRDKEVCVCELCDTLHLSQPLVSRHLKQMKEANILEARKKGKWMMYDLHVEPSNLLKLYINELNQHLHELPSLVVCETK